MPMCSYCHTVVNGDYQFCPECGRPLVAGEVVVGEPVEGKSKKRLAGIIVACTIAIIATIVLVTAKPWERTYTLNVGVSPPQAGFVSPSGGDYESGAQLTLTAYPTSGYTFNRWSGSTYGTTSSVTVTMDSDMNLTAHFEAIPAIPSDDQGLPEVLFADDFSDEASGWVTYDYYDGQVIYANGCLYVKDYATPEEGMYGESQRYFTDFILEVETWLVGGTDVNWHTVACRFQDEHNYYCFGIAADGLYCIIKFVDGSQVPLTGFEGIYSSYIHQGQGVSNLMHIECIGSSLSLSVNGHLLEQVTDTTFTGGDVALGAEAAAGTFTEVAFDNIVISEPSETIPAAPEVLFSDDFSDDTGVWDTFSDGDSSIFYENGWLHLVNYTLATGAATTRAYQYFTDVVLEVETKLIGGTDNNWHQVACRYQNDNNYYDFSISADGFYTIQKWVNGSSIDLVEITYSSYIQQGQGTTNLIHIDCIGSSLSLSVNGHLLEEVTDATFTGGDIALGASSLEASFTEIAFDNIVVREP